MNILAFAASASQPSINQQLIAYARRFLDGGDATVETLNIADYEMPLYTADRQEANGIPAAAHRFADKITAADGLLISFAEHNMSYTAAYKNLYDWASRIDMNVYQSKPMVMLATSPGSTGGRHVLAAAQAAADYFGGEVRAALAVPSFHKNYDAATATITDPALQQQIEAAVRQLLA